jgi:hypothetical protein
MIDANEIERASETLPVLLARLQEADEQIMVLTERAGSLLERLIDATESVMLMHQQLNETRHMPRR